MFGTCATLAMPGMEGKMNFGNVTMEDKMSAPLAPAKRIAKKMSRGVFKPNKLKRKSA
jgi:hypothetical protein